MISTTRRVDGLWVFIGEEPREVGWLAAALPALGGVVAGVYVSPWLVPLGLLVAISVKFSRQSRRALRLDATSLQAIRIPLKGNDQPMQLVAETTNGWVRREAMDRVATAAVKEVISEEDFGTGQNSQPSWYLTFVLADTRRVRVISDSDDKDVKAVAAEMMAFLDEQRMRAGRTGALLA